MKCHMCGAAMRRVITALPFRISETSIVILKELPVIECENCTEFLIEDDVMERVEAMLDTVNATAELEILRYAA